MPDQPLPRLAVPRSSAARAVVPYLTYLFTLSFRSLHEPIAFTYHRFICLSATGVLLLLSTKRLLVSPRRTLPRDFLVTADV